MSSARALDDLVECLAGNLRPPRDWRALVALSSETLTIGSLADALLSAPVSTEIPESIRELLVDVRVVRLDLGDQLLDEVFAMPSLVENSHGISVLSGVSRPCSREKEAAACPRTRTIRDQLPSLVATP